MAATASHTRRAWLRRVLPLGLGLGFIGAAARAQDAAQLERGVKAAFMYKFVDYVTWPDSAFASAAAPVRIGVAGDDDMAAVLTEAIANRTIHGRALSVRALPDGDNAVAGLHMLFVARKAAARLPRLLRETGNDPLLVVSESEGALEQGSMINFVLVAGRVRFDIAADAAERRGVRLSSRLLTVARVLRAAGSLP